MKKIAVVLFNLGGPRKPQDVKPFLLNLFNDPAIIGLPNPLRWLIARLIANRRTPAAQKVYAYLGGKSPLYENTEAQRAALEHALEKRDAHDSRFKVFVAMRYWHPLTPETVKAVKAWQADEVVLMPLYPQFSTTTTGSSVKEWASWAQKEGLHLPMRGICCYPRGKGFIKAYRQLLEETLAQIPPNHPTRILFSAHGLPKRVIAKGDPYQAQVEQTAAHILQEMTLPAWVDTSVCYQSRVGPLEWIGPAVDTEIERAGKDGRAVVVLPLAFVSEHSETLVELDIEYSHLAQKCGVPFYKRVPTVSTHPEFIENLVDLVTQILDDNQQKSCGTKNILGTPVLSPSTFKCPNSYTQCPCLS